MKEYLYPAFALVVLKVIILMRMFLLRVSNLKKGNVSPHYFKHYSGEHNLTREAVYTARNFDNLFQLPTLFYFTVAMIIFFKVKSNVALVLTWAFVATRYAHSLIHVTKNRLNQRASIYGFGWIIIIALWIILLLKA